MKTIFLLLTALLLFGCGTTKHTVILVKIPPEPYEVIGDPIKRVIHIDPLMYQLRKASRRAALNADKQTNRFTEQFRVADSAFKAIYGITVEIKDGHFRTDK